MELLVPMDGPFPTVSPFQVQLPPLLFEPPIQTCPPLVEIVPSKPTPPSLFVLSKSDQRITSNLPVPLVVMVFPLLTVPLPCIVRTPVPPDLVMIELLVIPRIVFVMDLIKISPVSDEVKAASMVMTPPCIFIGPATVMGTSSQRFPVLPGLPQVKERMVCPFWFQLNQFVCAP